MGASLARNLAPIADLVLPSRCAVCGTRLRSRHHLGVCAGCWDDVEPTAAPCPSCGASRAVADASRCGPCSLSPRPWSRAVAATVFEGPARDLLLRAKFAARVELFAPLGDRTASAIRADRLDEGVDAVVPVPSHPWSRIVRGLEAGDVLARRVGRRLGLPVVRALRRRWGAPYSIKRLGATARRRALRRAVAGRLPGAPRAVLLVDDVLTSGATAEACTRVLRELGALDVRLAVWARTPRDSA